MTQEFSLKFHRLSAGKSPLPLWELSGPMGSSDAWKERTRLVAAGCMVAWPAGASVSDELPQVADSGFQCVATTIAAWFITPWLGVACVSGWIVYEAWMRGKQTAV